MPPQKFQHVIEKSDTRLRGRFPRPIQVQRKPDFRLFRLPKYLRNAIHKKTLSLQIDSLHDQFQLQRLCVFVARTSKFKDSFRYSFPAVRPRLLESANALALRPHLAGPTMFATSSRNVNDEATPRTAAKWNSRPFTGQPTSPEAPAPVEFESAPPFGAKPSTDKNHPPPPPK
jgi:hypothetical protein